MSRCLRSSRSPAESDMRVAIQYFEEMLYKHNFLTMPTADGGTRHLAWPRQSGMPSLMKLIFKTMDSCDNDLSRCDSYIAMVRVCTRHSLSLSRDFFTSDP